IDMDIREIVKDLCKRKEITQKSLADQLGITAIGLNQILRKGNPNLQTLERIADALGVPITDLFEREEKGDFKCPNCGAPLNISVELTKEKE
ncbi:MAG: helix-turn-helix transcriptional regulator, partial [Mucinivorans sp.]